MDLSILMFLDQSASEKNMRLKSVVTGIGFCFPTELLNNGFLIEYATDVRHMSWTKTRPAKLTNGLIINSSKL